MGPWRRSFSSSFIVGSTVGFGLGCWVAKMEELPLLVFSDWMMLVNILMGAFIRSSGLTQFMAK